VVGRVAKLLEVREIDGLQPGAPALIQPVIAVADSGNNTVVEACDAQARDIIRIDLLLPLQRSPADHTQVWAATPLAAAPLRHCVAELDGVRVDEARRPLRLNYTLVPFVEADTGADWQQPTAEELAADALKAARLAAVSGLWLLSRPLWVEVGPLAQMREDRAPAGCLARLPCDIQPAVLLLDAGGNHVRDRQDSLVVANLVASSGAAPASPALDFTARVDSSGRATFTDLLVAVGNPTIRVNYTLQGAGAGMQIMGAAFSASGPAVALKLTVQPGRASPGLELEQQPEVLLVDAAGIRVTSLAPAALEAVPAAPGVLEAVPAAPGREPLPVPVVAVSVLAFTTRSATNEELVQGLPLVGNTRLAMERGRAVFTDVDLSYVGTCLQMSFSAERFPSSQAAASYGAQGTLAGLSLAEALVRPLSTRSAKLEVVIGAPHHLVPDRQPGQAVAGTVFGRQPRIAVLDAGDNVVERDSGSPVTALLTNGPASLLQGGAGRIVASSQGLVSYTNLRLDLASTCWVMTFKRPGVLPCHTRPLVVSPAAPHRLLLVKQPAGARPGAPLADQPVVQLIDLFDNLVWETETEVTVSLLLDHASLPSAPGVQFPAPYYGRSRGRGLVGATQLRSDAAACQHARCEALPSSCEAPVARAVVSFTDLRVDARDRGLGYRLALSAPGVLQATSATFHVEEGEGERLVVIQQPEGFRAGYRFKVMPRIALHDAGGNVIAKNVSVSVELKPVLAAVGEATLALTGTRRLFTESAWALAHELEPAARPAAVLRAADGGTGVAQFTDLGLESYTSSTASGLMLYFTASCPITCSYLGVRSREFTSGGSPTQLALLTAAFAGSVAGRALPVQPKVILQDLSRITVEFWDGHGADYALATASLAAFADAGADGRTAVLRGNTSAVYRNGVASWTDLRIDVSTPAPPTPFAPPPPGYFLTFSLRGKEWTQGGLLVTHAAPYAYHIWVEPGAGVAARPLATGAYTLAAVSSGGGPVIALLDRFGNRAESISEGVVAARLVNVSARALSAHPGPFEPIGVAQAHLARGLANFSQAGLGSKLAASGLRFNFSGHGVAPVPGQTEGWAFETASGPSSEAWPASAPPPVASPLETRFVVSQAFTVAVGGVEKLRLDRQPTVFVASNAVRPQPIVHLVDAGSNAVPHASWQTLAAVLVAPDGTQVRLASVQASEGVAAFQDVAMPSAALAGALLRYVCDPCQHGLAPIWIDSARFDVADFAGGRTIALHTPPSITSDGGQVFERQPVVAVHDSKGRLVTADSSTLVRATLLSLKDKETVWDLPSNVLQGRTEVTAELGLATFTDLRVMWCNDGASPTCTRHAKARIRFATERLSPSCAQWPERYPPIAPPCLPADSPELTILVGAPARLAVISQPRGAAPGLPFSSPPVVAVADAGGSVLCGFRYWCSS
jgi:hypothetical protein